MDLSTLTQKIRNEGLTPENRQLIRTAHKDLTSARPSPAAAAAAPESAAKAARQRMLDRSTSKPVSASAAEARQRMLSRSERGEAHYREFLRSGYNR